MSSVEVLAAFDVLLGRTHAALVRHNRQHRAAALDDADVDGVRPDDGGLVDALTLALTRGAMQSDDEARGRARILLASVMLSKHCPPSPEWVRWI